MPGEDERKRSAVGDAWGCSGSKRVYLRIGRWGLTRRKQVEVEAGLPKTPAGAWAEEDLGGGGRELECDDLSGEADFRVSLLRRARAAGVGCLVMNIGGGCASKRGRDKRVRFR